MFTVTPPTTAKRPLSPSFSSSPRLKSSRTFCPPSSSMTMTDSDLRQKLRLLPREQLESLIVQLAQFNPASKKSILSLLPTMSPKSIMDFSGQVEESYSLLETPYPQMRRRGGGRGVWSVAERIGGRLEEVVKGIVGSVQEYMEDENLDQGIWFQTWINGLNALISIGLILHSTRETELRQSLMNFGTSGEVSEGISILIHALSTSRSPVSSTESELTGKLEKVRNGLERFSRDMKQYGDDGYDKALKMLDGIIEDWADEDNGCGSENDDGRMGDEEDNDGGKEGDKSESESEEEY